MPKNKAVIKKHKARRKNNKKPLWRQPKDRSKAISITVHEQATFTSTILVEADELDGVEGLTHDLPLHVVKQEPQEPASRRRLKTIFDVDGGVDPLVGAPKDVQKNLDALALHLQKFPDDDDAFAKIHCYIHKYLLGLIFKKFTWVPGHDSNDLYQESLIAISKKAIPNFNPNKGMSFLNFAKMVINRHLITILNSAKKRKKDVPLNQAISLDHNPSSGDDDDENCILSNIISDNKITTLPYEDLAKRESFAKSLATLKTRLSPFESLVLDQYLQKLSYNEIAKNVSKATGIKYNAKAIDNGLLRLRRKCFDLLKECGANGENEIPIMFEN